MSRESPKRSETRSESIRRSWERRRVEGKDRLSPEARAKVSAALKGRAKDPELREKIGTALRATSEEEKAAFSDKIVSLKCRHCGNDFEAFRSRPWYCDDCAGSHRDGKGQGRLRRYGLTDAEFQSMLERQGGVCAICSRPFDQTSHKDRLAVDHDHTTGKVRGLLHVICNRLLGQIEAGLLSYDFPALARLYLSRQAPDEAVGSSAAAGHERWA